jgi:hypothetical protein
MFYCYTGKLKQWLPINIFYWPQCMAAKLHFFEYEQEVTSMVAPVTKHSYGYWHAGGLRTGKES